MGCLRNWVGHRRDRLQDLADEFLIALLIAWIVEVNEESQRQRQQWPAAPESAAEDRNQ